MSFRDELACAVDLSRNAGRLALEHYGRVERLTKRHAEAVTDADRACQRLIVAGLKARYPHDGIIGEENETGDAITFDCPDPAGRVWVIDPIDGTNNFIAGFPAFAVCIALLDQGYPVVGVVHDVCRNQFYTAARGEGVRLDDQPVRAAATPLNESSLLMLTSNLLDRNRRLPQWATRFISQTAWKVRCIGSAALEAAQVATGIAHGAITMNGKLWDAAAPAALVLEAGGSFTTIEGTPIFPFDLAHYSGAKVPFLASAPNATQQLLEEIRLNP